MSPRYDQSDRETGFSMFHGPTSRTLIEFYQEASSGQDLPMNPPRKNSQNLLRGGGPGRGRGRVQRAAARVVRLAGGRVVTARDVLTIAFVRRKVLRGLAWRTCDYKRAWRALERVAVRVRQDRTKPGKPWLWRRKPD
jgi:hypothetical protein